MSRLDSTSCLLSIKWATNRGILLFGILQVVIWLKYLQWILRQIFSSNIHVEKQCYCGQNLLVHAGHLFIFLSSQWVVLFHNGVNTSLAVVVLNVVFTYQPVTDDWLRQLELSVNFTFYTLFTFSN